MRRTSCGIEVSPVPWEGQQARFHSSKGRTEGGEELGEVRKSSILKWQLGGIFGYHIQIFPPAANSETISKLGQDVYLCI